MSEGVVDWVEVGRRLRRIRSESGTSQREFGRLFGVSQNMISLYEKGKSRATVDFYVRAAQLGGKTIEWLLTGREDRALETLREMRDLHEKMKGHLGVVRQLLNQEAGAAFDQTIPSIDDPDQLRKTLLAEKDLPVCLTEVLEDPATWRTLAMTGREVCAFCNLVNAVGEIRTEGLDLFLRLVRRATPRGQLGKLHLPLPTGMADAEDVHTPPADPI